MIYITSSVLFLVFGDDERAVVPMDYVLTVLFAISFITYSDAWIFNGEEPEWATCYCGFGMLCGLFAIPTISIWYFINTDWNEWNQQIPLYMLVFKIIKSFQLLSISVSFVIMLFGRCCSIW